MESRFTSPREIAQLNIEHYSGLLQTSLDGKTRMTVGQLLAEEKAKLAELSSVQRTLGRASQRDCANSVTTASNVREAPTNRNGDHQS